MSRRKLAEYFEVSVRTLDRYVERYRYPFFYLGTNIRFDLMELLAHIKKYQPSIGTEGEPKKGTRKKPAYRPDLDDSAAPQPQRFSPIRATERVKVRVDCIQMQEEGDHVFSFGETKHRLAREQYDLVSIGQAHGPLLMNVDMWVRPSTTEDLNLQSFIVQETDDG